MNELKRLTTDEPHGNLETMLNYAYAKDKRVCLRYGDGEENIDLCEYIAREAAEKGCAPSAEEVTEGSCMECDCPLAMVYVVATQAAELRGRLKDIEDRNRVISIPYAVGDFVYALWSAPVKAGYIIYCAEVKKITISKRNCRTTTTLEVEPIEFRGRRMEYREEDCGTLVFDDKEAAEAALEELNKAKGEKTV